MKKINKNILTMMFLIVLSGVAGSALALQDLTAELPNARAGECYAKVVFPAQYKTETTTVVVQEESESLEIQPARFEWVKKLVRVGDAGSELKEIPAQFGTEIVPFQISPASTSWVMGSVDSVIPVNPLILSMARAGGADIDDARPGQCFDEYFTPATFRSVTERILVAEAVEEISLSPAEYEWVEERVQVAPASKKLKVVPAVFEAVEESIKVEDAKKVWVQGTGEVERIDYATGEIMHLVDEPAKYKTVRKLVLKEAPRSEVIDIPARYEAIRVHRLVSDAAERRVTLPEKYQDVSRIELATEAVHKWYLSSDSSVTSGDLTGVRICLQELPEKMSYIERTVVEVPPSVKRIQFPARYDVKQVQQLVSEAKEIRMPNAARTEAISKRSRVAEQRMEWLPVLCEKDTTNEIVQRVQLALESEGYSVGPIDGFLGYQTMTAIERFQIDKELATGGLTYDTLDELGIEI